MELHGNARLTPVGRELMCRRVRDELWTPLEAAEATGCSKRTWYRWLTRHDAGEPMMASSSASIPVPGRTAPEVEELIGQLRRLRWTSTKIAAELDMATSTVCAVLVRLGLNRLSKRLFGSEGGLIAGCGSRARHRGPAILTVLYANRAEDPCAC